MTSKWVKKSCGLRLRGRLTEFELKNTHWDFHGLKNTCSFTCKPTTKCIESCVYFTEFFGFRFLTRVLMGNYLPVWALIVGISVYSKIYPNHALRASKTPVRAHDRVLTSRRHPPPPFGDDNGGGGGARISYGTCLSILKRCMIKSEKLEKRSDSQILGCRSVYASPAVTPPPGISTNDIIIVVNVKFIL